VVCSDPSLPSTEALRGITPLVDPAFNDADIANALSEKTKAAPLDAKGKSILDLMQGNGVQNVAGQAVDGSTVDAAGAGQVSSQAGSAGNATVAAPSAATGAAAAGK
jgi:hypothetical protein